MVGCTIHYSLYNSFVTNFDVLLVVQLCNVHDHYMYKYGICLKLACMLNFFVFSILIKNHVVEVEPASETKWDDGKYLTYMLA
jgi:hypothetical protein